MKRRMVLTSVRFACALCNSVGFWSAFGGLDICLEMNFFFLNDFVLDWSRKVFYSD